MKPTPYLLMDLDKVEDAHTAMAEAMSGIGLLYAVKCNPDRGVLARLHDNGCGFEIASLAELELLLEVGVDPAEVYFSNPVKPVSHIAGTYARGVRRYSFDSKAEVDKLAFAAPGADVYVRIASVPPSELLGEASSVVASEGKFGVEPSKAVELIELAIEKGLNAYGIAFHVGSQMMEPSAWEPPIETASEIMRRLALKGIELEMLDVGGGYPAFYGTTVPHISEFGERIAKALELHLPYDVRVVAEPGRGLVAEAGTMVSTVIGRAERFGKQWIHLDVGAFNGMMEALEAQNQLRFPMSDSVMSERTELFNVTGPSCDSQDTILFDVPLSYDLAVGDRVYIGSAGAYTTSYASNFNGFDIPQTFC